MSLSRSGARADAQANARPAAASCAEAPAGTPVGTPAGAPAPAAATESLSAKLERGDLMAAACPSREVLKHLTSRWGVLVLIALLPGTRRFSELRRRIGGVSERMLAQTLQWLEADGIVERRAFEVVPPHVEYTLTPLGREAAARVRDLADWIELALPEIERQRAGQLPEEADQPAGRVVRRLSSVGS